MTVAAAEEIQEKLYTHSEAARAVPVSYHTISHWVAKNWLEVHDRTSEGTMIFTESALRKVAAARGFDFGQSR